MFEQTQTVSQNISQRDSVSGAGQMQGQKCGSPFRSTSRSDNPWMVGATVARRESAGQASKESSNNLKVSGAMTNRAWTKAQQQHRKMAVKSLALAANNSVRCDAPIRWNIRHGHHSVSHTKRTTA
jgi:hypothetical protein